MPVSTIKDPSIKLKPSISLCEFIGSLDDDDINEMPENVYKIYQGYSKILEYKKITDIQINKPNLNKNDILIIKELNKKQQDDKNVKLDDIVLLDSDDDNDDDNDNGDDSGVDDDNDDEDDVKNIKIEKGKKISKAKMEKYRATLKLNLNDIKWINELLIEQRKKNIDDETKQNYLHELMNGTKLILPKNEIKPRDPILEARCVRLRLEQNARVYNKMTKNVDNSRKFIPEDTIAYQMKQINRHLIAILQFVFSVAAGFAFGFIGLELMFGDLDFGFRLLMGIIFALIIALAEIYFLAKQLNQEYDMSVEQIKLASAVTTTDSSGISSNANINGGKVHTD